MTEVLVAKLLIFKWWPETGSNRRRRPFQGPLPMDLSRLESADPIETKAVQCIADLGLFGISWDGFLPRLFPYCSRPTNQPIPPYATTISLTPRALCCHKSNLRANGSLQRCPKR